MKHSIANWIVNVKYSRTFKKHWAKARRTEFAHAIEKLVNIVLKNPFQNPPPYEKLCGCQNTYSRRINEQHRLVYVVDIENGKIEFTRCWGHYE